MDRAHYADVARSPLVVVGAGQQRPPILLEWLSCRSCQATTAADAGRKPMIDIRLGAPWVLRSGGLDWHVAAFCVTLKQRLPARTARIGTVRHRMS